MTVAMGWTMTPEIGYELPLKQGDVVIFKARRQVGGHTADGGYEIEEPAERVFIFHALTSQEWAPFPPAMPYSLNPEIVGRLWFRPTSDGPKRWMQLPVMKEATRQDALFGLRQIIERVIDPVSGEERELC